MSAHDIRDAHRPPFDSVLQAMTDYVMDYDASQSSLAMETARFADGLPGPAPCGAGLPGCTKLLEPHRARCLPPAATRVARHQP